MFDHCLRSRRYRVTARLAATASSWMFGLCGCGGSVGESAGQPDSGSLVELVDGASDATSRPDAPTTDTSVDASVDTRVDTLPAPSDVGGPLRLPCLGRKQLAADLPKNVDGALEGELVSIVPPGTGGACPNDADHLHLQIQVGTSRYDVAITVNDTTTAAPMAIFAKDLAPASAPQGWSSARFDYVTDLGVHASDFTPFAKAELVARWLVELKDATHVSVHGLSYTDGTGLHDVHRNGGGHDGVVLVHLGSADHAIAQRFSTSAF